MERLKEEILKAIEKSFCENTQTYFSYAWKQNIGEMLENESKYASLVSWIDKEIETCKTIINIFCPADKTEDYTNADIRNYLSYIQKFSVLTHCKLLLLDGRSDIKMRENIEYALCKLYNISYSEELNNYT